MTSTLCECGCSKFRPKRYPALENIEKINNFLPLYSKTPKTAVIGEYWRKRILTPYSRRVLTKPTDKLVALTAVASRLQSEFGSTYLAGLWKDDLIFELLWYVERRPGHHQGHVPIRQESSYAPTWSWVSVHAPMCWRPFNDYSDISQLPLARVLEAYTCPSTLNPFGPVSDGQIKLSAIVRSITATYNDENGYWKFPATEMDDKYNEDNTSLVEFDTPIHVTDVDDDLNQLQHTTARRLHHGEGEESQKSEIRATAIPLIAITGTHPDGSESRSMYGLVLQESTTRAGYFQRLGRFKIMGFTEDVQINRMARQEIVMI